MSEQITHYSNRDGQTVREIVQGWTGNASDGLVRDLCLLVDDVVRNAVRQSVISRIKAMLGSIRNPNDRANWRYDMKQRFGTTDLKQYTEGDLFDLLKWIAGTEAVAAALAPDAFAEPAFSDNGKRKGESVMEKPLIDVPADKPKPAPFVSALERL